MRLGVDLPSQVIEVGRKGPAFAQGGTGALTGGGELGAGERPGDETY